MLGEFLTCCKAEDDCLQPLIGVKRAANNAIGRDIR